MWTLGHVRYVAEPGSGPDVTGGDLVRAVLGDPVGLIAVLTLLAILMLFGVLLPVHPKWGAFRVVLDDALRGYRAHLPLILRLSAGIALMGAGVGGYWFVPHAPFSARLLSLVFMACGFGLLVGVAVTFLALLAGILWLYGLATQTRDLFMASDVFAMFVLLAVVSAGRPSVDDLLVKALPSAPVKWFDAKRLKAALDPDPTPALAGAFDTWIPFVARLGLGIALLYAGVVEKFLDPGPAMATLGRYGLDLGGLDPAFWVVVVGATEILLGLGIITGIGTRPFAALAFLAFTMTLFALPDDPVVAHVPAWGIATIVFILGAGRWTVGRSFERLQAARAERGAAGPARSPTCPACGTDVAVADRYCPQCGTMVPGRAEAETAEDAVGSGAEAPREEGEEGEGEERA